VGGSHNGHNNGESDPITLNMLQTETINRSRAFGAVALEKMGQVNHLKFSKVQRAPFKVLKLPDITSLLVETAFISNSREELMLRSSSYQTDIAWAIAYAVDEFVPLPYAADRSWCKKVFSSKVSSSSVPATYVTYKVKKGDILERIAGRHGTTLNTMIKAQQSQVQKPYICWPETESSLRISGIGAIGVCREAGGYTGTDCRQERYNGE